MIVVFIFLWEKSYEKGRVWHGLHVKTVCSFIFNICSLQWALILYTQTSVCIFSILLSKEILWCWQGEFDTQELLKLVIISFIHMTWICDSGVILLGGLKRHTVDCCSSIFNRCSILITNAMKRCGNNVRLHCPSL